MAPRTYKANNNVAQIRANSRPERKRTKQAVLPLEEYEGQFWHTAKDAAVILQKLCGEEGFSYSSLLAALESDYLEGVHWFRRGGIYKVNIQRILKYPPGCPELSGELG